MSQSSENGPMNELLATVEWTECQPPSILATDGLPHVTHEGIIRVGGRELKCYQLSDGNRVFNCEDLERFFELVPPKAERGG